MVMYVTRRDPESGRLRRVKVTSESLRKQTRVHNLTRMYEALGAEGFEEYCWLLRKNADVVVATEALGIDYFPNITLDAAHKAVIDGYMAVPANWRQVVKVGVAPDFKVQNKIAASEFADLPKVPKGSTYENITLSDEKATLSVEKRGAIFAIDLESRANDDLGLLTDTGGRFGRAAQRTIGRFVFNDLIQANPTIYNGAALFAAGHNNTVTSAAAINAKNLEAVVAKMRKQKGRATIPGATAAETEIYLTPRYLLCNLDDEWAALRLLATEMLLTGGAAAILPGEATVNVVRGLFRGVVASPFLTTAGVWYVVTDPAETALAEVDFWRGIEEPEVFQEPAGTGHEFETDATRVKARTIFGGAILDFRPIVKASA